ncbi:hypothetical protein [Thiocapsa marina]|uniref:hypothetical protein n=1 Tax=Thiocapsa marina TaxID=244573 RepID=UPI0011129107|nr:hypothetical protein [Thiocapsa marina]
MDIEPSQDRLIPASVARAKGPEAQDGRIQIAKIGFLVVDSAANYPRPIRDIAEQWDLESGWYVMRLDACDSGTGHTGQSNWMLFESP